MKVFFFDKLLIATVYFYIRVLKSIKLRLYFQGNSINDKLENEDVTSI